MAIAKTARVSGSRRTGAGTRMLALETAAPLGFIGGQYIIVDSGLVLPSGKAAKRAYSMLSNDADQTRIEIAVKRIPNGPGSAFLHRVEVGTTIRFSGPWGKLAPLAGVGGRTLVIATDTGITAALGLVRSARFAALRPATLFVWLRPSPDGALGIDSLAELPGAEASPA